MSDYKLTPEQEQRFDECQAIIGYKHDLLQAIKKLEENHDQTTSNE